MVRLNTKTLIVLQNGSIMRISMSRFVCHLVILCAALGSMVSCGGDALIGYPIYIHSCDPAQFANEAKLKHVPSRGLIEPIGLNPLGDGYYVVQVLVAIPHLEEFSRTPNKSSDRIKSIFSGLSLSASKATGFEVRDDTGELVLADGIDLSFRRDRIGHADVLKQLDLRTKRSNTFDVAVLPIVIKVQQSSDYNDKKRFCVKLLRSIEKYGFGCEISDRSVSSIEPAPKIAR